MASAPQTVAAPRRTATATRWNYKYILWLIMAAAAAVALYFTEAPILRDLPGNTGHLYRLRLLADRYLFVPHALGGTIALLAGPIQFSTRLRRKHLQFHRILGRVYVVGVFVAVPCAIAIEVHGTLLLATAYQATLWFLCTLAALLTARNRQLVQHRQWMIRSYAMTFTFILLRVLNFIPAYANISDQAFTLVDIMVGSAAVMLPTFAFNWRELTTRRA